ncbi:MAG: MFS transporter [Spirochaetales bacterium]|nr:MFS transporter [Spirochaetales bacterium]
MSDYRRNINRNYFFIFFSNINFTTGLWMIYLSQKGFSLIELGILESVFHISSMIFEIPSGAFADLIGRKFCRLGGRLALILSLVVMYLADNFIFQAAGFMICAFGYNLESGAGEAFVYDSLKAMGREDKYLKIAGFIELAFQAATIISFAVGGLLASECGYFYVFLFSTAAALTSFMTGLAFVEVKNGGLPENDGEHEVPHIRNFRAFGKILSDSFNLIRSKPRIMFLIIFSEVIFAFTTSLFFYLQNYFKISGWNESKIGIVYAMSAGLSALSSIFAVKIEKKAEERRLLILLPVLLTVCLWGVGLTPFKAVFFIATGLIEGILIVVISDYLNRLIPSDIRATVLSFQSMTFSLIMIILFPLIGAVGEFLSLETAFRMMAGTATIFAVFYAVRFRRQP